MNRTRFSFFHKLAAITLLLALLLAGCSRATDQPPTPSEPAGTTEPTLEVTLPPAAPPERILLVDPAGAATPELIAYLSAFAAENSLVFETATSPELSPQTAETRVVIVLADAAGMRDLAAASPDTQFIVSGNIETGELANLSVITTRAEDLAFMGGYLTQIIAWDWRAAGVIPTDTIMAAEKADAYVNGGRYLCGRCIPFYAPIVAFPLLAQESAQADALAWSAQVATLGEHYVNSFYVDPDVASAELLDSLMGLESYIYNDVKLVGLSGTPNPERFTALLGYDLLPAVQQILPQAAAGTGGLVMGAQVEVLSYSDEAVITPGRVENFNRVAADLAAGIISPLSIP